MIVVLMNGNQLPTEFKTKEEARKYVSSCKKMDKRYGESHKYNVKEIK